MSESALGNLLTIMVELIAVGFAVNGLVGLDVALFTVGHEVKFDGDHVWVVYGVRGMG